MRSRTDFVNGLLADGCRLLQAERGCRSNGVVVRKIDANLEVCGALLGAPWPSERDLDSATNDVDLTHVISAPIRSRIPERSSIPRRT